MTNPTEIGTAVIGVAIMSLITFATRALPFLAFKSHLPGRRFLKFQELLPPLVLSILLVYASKDYMSTGYQDAIIAIACLGITALLHLVWRNPLISIFSGTILYLVGMQIWS